MGRRLAATVVRHHNLVLSLAELGTKNAVQMVIAVLAEPKFT
jgi:hypothetical protein